MDNTDIFFLRLFELVHDILKIINVFMNNNLFCRCCRGTVSVLFVFLFCFVFVCFVFVCFVIDDVIFVRIFVALIYLFAYFQMNFTIYNLLNMSPFVNKLSSLCFVVVVAA